MRTISNERLATALLAALLCSGCDGVDDTNNLQPPQVFEIQDEVVDRTPPPASGERTAFFGDLHVHTTYSFDAFMMGTVATPYDAYRFAKGEPIKHAAGFDLQLKEPLDFYAVTDHAMFLGVAKEAADTSTKFSKYELAEPLHDLNAPDSGKSKASLPGRLGNFAGFLPDTIQAVMAGEIEREELLDITRSAWVDIVEAADLHNDPGRFTTFVGYEYTTWADGMGNLHRNVIFRGSDKLPAVPFSRLHSGNPEDLWAWMDRLRGQGIESLAIPHNSNGSNGQMFKLVDWAENPMDDAYAEVRMRNEPIVEITQIKGTSETHPLLSNEDEWADFEIMEERVGSNLESDKPGSYVRDALLRGLTLEHGGIANPYEFGFIGSSDTHTAAAENDESNFHSKLGLVSATADLRGSVPFSPLLGTFLGLVASDITAEVDGQTYMGGSPPTFGASGLAAVWAEENTRDSIYDAFRRKETFATSGPRIKLRFFGGHDFDPAMLDRTNLAAQAYARGVSMGGELTGNEGRTPTFLVWALADPTTRDLQRAQIVKGWIDDAGETHEFVYDVACSGGASVDPKTHRCPDNGARVDTSTCAVSGDGASELLTLWTDPDFDPTQRAFYYARVLENPTCRWSTWDALREGIAPRSDLPSTIQERAWSSPIHYKPGGSSDGPRPTPNSGDA